jgi:hypothetical protein
MQKTVISMKKTSYLSETEISPIIYFRICTNVYTPYSIGYINYTEVKIGMVHFVEFGKFSKFGDK